MTVNQVRDTPDHESEATLEGWSERHPVVSRKSMWSDEEFTGFMNNQVLPKYLRSEMILNMLERLLLKTEYGETGLFFFDSWCEQRLADRVFEEEDRYGLQTWLMHIVCSWMSTVVKLESGRSDHASRNGVENIIELAFQLRGGADQEWQRDAELVLPDEPNAVIADSIAGMPFPSYWQNELGRYYPLSWSYSNKAESVISFVFVASRNDSTKKSTHERLRMCFFSAQKHRRALYYKDGPVFGAILHKGILDFFVSTWEADKLVVRPTLRRYTIRFFSDFLECYLVFCRIEEYTQQFLQSQFDELRKSTWLYDEKLRQTRDHPWRSETRDGVALDICDVEEIEIGREGGADARIDLSKLKNVHDRHSRIVLASVLREPYSAEIGFPLTRKNKKAFDIITSVDNENGDIRVIHDPSVWAEDTYNHRDEFEEPTRPSDNSADDFAAKPASPCVTQGPMAIAPDTQTQTPPQNASLASGATLAEMGPVHAADPERTYVNASVLTGVVKKTPSNSKGTVRTKPKRRSERIRKQLGQPK